MYNSQILYCSDVQVSFSWHFSFYFYIQNTYVHVHVHAELFSMRDKPLAHVVGLYLVSKQEKKNSACTCSSISLLCTYDSLYFSCLSTDHCKNLVCFVGTVRKKNLLFFFTAEIRNLNLILIHKMYSAKPFSIATSQN